MGAVIINKMLNLLKLTIKIGRKTESSIYSQLLLN